MINGDFEYDVGITMSLAPPIFLGMVNIPTIYGDWVMVYHCYTHITKNVP